MRRRRTLLVLAAFALLVPAGRVGAASQPQFDLFETDPETTRFSFEGSAALSPNFFGPGSDRFSGRIRLGGVPLGTFQKRRVGDADTAIRREGGGRPGTAAIRLVRLSLEGMRPLTVTYDREPGNASKSNGGPREEQWTVKVSPSLKASSKGTVSIRAAGRFDSTLLVVPRLTFTRIPDGKRRTMDLASLGSAAGQALTFHQRGGFWRRGCVLPALSVPGLNDGFCAGLTSGGEKKLTVEEAQLASHGIYPAQPLLEHFQCYEEKPSLAPGRSVVLVDRFGQRNAVVKGRAELCDPVQKGDEKVINDRAHLECYVTGGPPVRRRVIVQNQFGSQRLLIKSPTRLCAPSEKRIVQMGGSPDFPRILLPIDHFQCYAAEPRGPLWTLHPVRRVNLEDQLGKRVATIQKAFQLCAPTEKRWNGDVAPLAHPVRDLVCYRTNSERVKKSVEIRNQFERHEAALRQAVSLCVPSNQVVLP